MTSDKKRQVYLYSPHQHQLLVGVFEHALPKGVCKTF
jgi:hypothetical protein